MDRAVEVVESVSEARADRCSRCRGESMSSSCRSLEAEKGGGGVGEMVHLDPGLNPLMN